MSDTYDALDVKKLHMPLSRLAKEAVSIKMYHCDRV